MQIRSIAAFALLTFIAAATSAQDMPFAGQLHVNGGPTITFSGNVVSCSGLSPGDSVALVAFSIDRRVGKQTITTPAVSSQADANGNFATSIKGGIKARSVWLLIDQTTGGYTVAAPQGSVLRQMQGTVSAWEGRPVWGGPLPPGTATINRAHTHVIWVGSTDLQSDSRPRRPRAQAFDPPPPDAPDPPPNGITVFDAKDGSATDSDGAIDGSVQLTFPGPLAVGDILFVVDDHTLEFLVFVLDSCNLLGECRV